MTALPHKGFARAEALRLQMVREFVGLGLQLPQCDLAVAALDGTRIGGGIDRVFEQISDVVSHSTRLEHVLVCGYHHAP